MMPFCNNLRKDDEVLDTLSGRSGVVATTPRETSKMTAVVLVGTNSLRYLYVKNLRLIVDGKPEDVPPIDGEVPEEGAMRRQPAGPAGPGSPLLAAAHALQRAAEALDEVRRHLAQLIPARP